MKREVMFISIFIIFLVSASLIHASEEVQVANAYSCLESRINQTGCSALSFEEKVFSALADGKCMSELSKDNSSNQCWPKSGCTIKSTAEAILVLNKRVNTTKAENWLLSPSQISVPKDIDWFLEIESSGVTNCNITYSGHSYPGVIISEDKKIHSNAGPSLILDQNNYWLKIAPAIYNKDITISCNDSFITTLLFKKTDSSTVHVSEATHTSESNGDTNEQVNSFCFAQGGVCNYEGSLWAALVLNSLGYEEDIQPFMPYLITMMDDPSYQQYLPESFLYYLTGKFRTELLLKQKSKSYWEVSGDRYSDTALALLPFPPDSSDSPTERSNSITWLLSDQQRSGCWNSNLKDTAFLLYSVWPKDISDCPEVSCQIASESLDGTCSYADVQCGINGDGCCSPGCVYANDNDCPDTRCTSDSDCNSDDHTDGPYCSDDGKSVYEEVYTNTCDSTGTCVQNVDDTTTSTCSNTETCENGACVSTGTTCGLFSPCGTGYTCVSGVCQANGGECDSSTPCDQGYTCNNGVCEPVDTSCGFLNPCDTGYTCTGGTCIANTCDQDGCPDGQICVASVCVAQGCTNASDCTEEDCQVASCDTGTCLYAPVGCANGDSCCSAGCNSTNDDYCPLGPECTSDADCKDNNYISYPYCSDDGSKVFTDFHNYTCESQSCVDNLVEKVSATCTSSEECYNGECVSNESPVNTSCEDNFGCTYDEQCVGGECVPYECTSNGECNSGNCTGGYCVSTTLDCKDSGYFCTSSVSCENSYGTALTNYFCSGSLSVCCDTKPALRTCDEEGGSICTSDKTCTDGTTVDVSDTMSGETCCLAGTCEAKTTTTYCIDENGTCKSSCDTSENEKSYVCDTAGEICCVAGETAQPSRLWIFIVIFLVLIALSVVGIVFRDKLRVQWIKLKDKLGGKKENKKFDMPLTSHPNPQGRILPRRIFPPGQQPMQPQPQQPGTQLRRPMQQPTQNKPQINKKPEEKPKNELDDVLKKLKEMGK